MTKTEVEVDPDEVEVLDEEEEVRNLPAVQVAEALVARGEISVDEVVAQKEKIRQVMERVMTNGVHYGVIPGTQRPSLYKPGAESILVALRLAPDYEVKQDWGPGDHLTVTSKCVLRHIQTGLVISAGSGLCSTRESRYAWRTKKRTCPACGAEAIIKGKAEYGGGWVCWRKADPTPGCGAAYADGDPAIEDQKEGKVENPDLPDLWNTVLKMADKRALIAAVLNGTAASDVFTQDVEDRPGQGDVQEGARGPARRDGNEATVPKTWAEMRARIEQGYDKLTAVAFDVFIGELAFRMFDGANVGSVFGTPDGSALSAPQWTTLGQKVAGAVMNLMDAVPPGGALPPTREQIVAAFQSVAKDYELEGPPWRMGPDEMDRPAYEAAA